MANIGFIGLGNMGAPMARNLLTAGHQVKVFDLNQHVVNLLAEEGAQACQSAHSAVENVSIVISMLPAAMHVKSLYLGENGLINHIKGGTQVIDCSTIDAASAVEVGAALKAKDIAFVDAPVSGGITGAKAGTLTFIVGGETEHFNHVEPILKTMGKNIFHAGDVGAGQVAKICNNMLLAVVMAGTSEALQMGINHGLDPKLLSDIMLNSTGRNWALELYNPCPNVIDSVPSSNDYKPGFMVDLMAKDLGLALEAAQASGSSTPMGALSRNLYSMLQNQGAGKKDFSAIFTLFEKH